MRVHLLPGDDGRFRRAVVVGVYPDEPVAAYGQLLKAALDRDPMNALNIPREIDGHPVVLTASTETEH